VLFLFICAQSLRTQTQSSLLTKLFNRPLIHFLGTAHSKGQPSLLKERQRQVMTPQHYPPSTATPTSKYSKAATESPSYRSTPDSRSSVLSRAREYTRRIEDENKRRSQSLDRHQQARLEQQQLNSNKNNLAPTPSRSHSRSHSHSQSQQGNQHLNHSSFESAVERQSVGTTPSPTSYRTARPTSLSSTGGSNRSPRSHSAGGGGGGGATSSSYFGNRLSTRERAMASVEKENSRGNNNNSYQYHHRQQQQQQQQQSSPATKVANTMSSNHYNGAPATTMSASSHGPHAEHRSQRAPHTSSSPSRSFAARRGERSNRGPGAGGNGYDGDGDEHQEHEAVVSPELLVDALSGHEDGLLAIAERLMEHYDSGYDAMGEAIIDAFADVQKLFQHVVEAAHMEGAAFEASRREEELALQKLQQQELNGMNDDAMIGDGAADNNLTSPTGPMRHDEFIDQDVKDCLNDAIRKGTSLKEQNQHAECYALYESACQSASSLLPVDSDHRGRLQLSIARAESMSPDRGCAILRYAMDDVLRSGLRAGKIPPPDISKRADVVLSKPKGHPSMTGSAGAGVGVVQSSEEALNSLVEEMKEIMDAPVYKDTPLQDVAKRFWAALQENKKISSKNEERLEHNLGKLKGDFLLARAVSKNFS
jgi:hypothetical protein